MNPKALTNCCWIPIKKWYRNTNKKRFHRFCQVVTMAALYPIYANFKSEDMKKPFQIELDENDKYILVGDTTSSEAAQKGLLSSFGRKLRKKDIKIALIEPGRLLQTMKKENSGIHLMFCFSVANDDTMIPIIEKEYSKKIKQTSIVLIKKYMDKPADIRNRVRKLKEKNDALYETPVLTYSNYFNPIAFLSIIVVFYVNIRTRVQTAKSVK